MPRGWPNEPARHGLAAKGIKTVKRTLRPVGSRTTIDINEDVPDKAVRKVLFSLKGVPEEHTALISEVRMDEELDNLDIIDARALDDGILLDLIVGFPEAKFKRIFRHELGHVVAYDVFDGEIDPLAASLLGKGGGAAEGYLDAHSEDGFVSKYGTRHEKSWTGSLAEDFADAYSAWLDGRLGKFPNKEAWFKHTFGGLR